MLKYILTFIPLIGTSLGAFLGASNLKNKFKKSENALVAVATGILCSIAFNLLLESAEFIRSTIMYFGVLAGFLFIALVNFFARKNNMNIKSKLFWAMLIHNIPEGIVVGLALSNETFVSTTFSLIASISLQNLPDGFVVSMPLVSTKGNKKALLLGIISGIVEPIAAILILVAAGKNSNLQTLEPFLIGFSFSAILLIAVDLLKECKKELKIVVISLILALLFNSILE